MVLAPPTELGLPGDMAVGPSELSSGRGGRSTEEKAKDSSQVILKFGVFFFKFTAEQLPLTHVIHDGGLCSLAIEVDHGIDAGRDVPGGRALSDTVYKEVEAAVLFPYYADRVTGLQGR